MSIVSAIRAWFNKEVVSRVADVESKLEAILICSQREADEVEKSLSALLTEAGTTLKSLDLNAVRKAVIATVLAELKADGVHITEALLEKYGVPSSVSEPVAEAVVHIAADAVEAAA